MIRVYTDIIIEQDGRPSVTDSIELSTNSAGKITCSDDGFATWDIQRHQGRAK